MRGHHSAEFDETFESYNELQKLQGMDLSRYKGQRAKRYTYTVLNYPGQEEGVQANVLVLNDTIIGGDVSSVAIDGFMHGFAIPDDY